MGYLSKEECQPLLLRIFEVRRHHKNSDTGTYRFGGNEDCSYRHVHGAGRGVPANSLNVYIPLHRKSHSEKNGPKWRGYIFFSLHTSLGQTICTIFTSFSEI